MGNTAKSSGFSLIELLVVVTIIVILFALAFPGVRMAMVNYKKLACTNNLQQLSIAFSLYRTEHNQRFPSNGLGGGTRWVYQISPYISSATNSSLVGYNLPVVHCPLTPAAAWKAVGGIGAYGCYGINVNIAPWTDSDIGLSYFQINNPSTKVLLAELSCLSFNGIGGQNSAIIGTTPYPPNPTGPAANHRLDGNPANGPKGPSNFLFVDGHVETLNECPVTASFSATQ